MVRRPPAGVIPAGHPSLPRVWSRRKIESKPFRYMSDLIAALYAVAPRVLIGSRFLDRAVLVDGVSPGTSPRDLADCFGLLDVEGSVLVRDSSTGFRVGLVVFSDAADAATATTLPVRPGFYAYCVPATSHGEPPSYISDALRDLRTRRPLAELFRSLVPPQYLLDDKTMDFHLRCVFFGAGGAGSRTAGGAYGLCRLGGDVLLASGYLSAVIACSDGGAGVLVYDDPDTPEMVSRRAPRLLQQFGLQMHDTSVFPLPAEPADREATLLRRLLPPYISEERYRCRVVLLTGLDTTLTDAAQIAYAVKYRLDLIYELEAVIIHRSRGAVLLVLGCSEDLEIVLQEPPDTWVLAFGRQVTLVSVFGSCPCPSEAASVSDTSPPLEKFTRLWCSTKVLEYAREVFTRELKARGDQMSSCLIRLCALAQPDAVWRQDFSDRAILLSGIALDASWCDLWSALLRFDILDDLILCASRRVALAIFRSRTGALGLLREPAESWRRMGFDDCRRVPGTEVAGIVADEVQLTLSVIDAMGPDF